MNRVLAKAEKDLHFIQAEARRQYNKELQLRLREIKC